jgi:hypothetical protein
VNDREPDSLRDGRTAVGRGKAQKGKKGTLWLCRKRAAMRWSSDQGNPPGLFAYLLRGACWRYITQGDEDRANARIKAFLRGPELPAAVAKAQTRPALSRDARMVGEFRRAIAAAEYRGDPFPPVCRHDPSWTRERWDAALVELEETR